MQLTRALACAIVLAGQALAAKPAPNIRGLQDAFHEIASKLPGGSQAKGAVNATHAAPAKTALAAKPAAVNIKGLQDAFHEIATKLPGGSQAKGAANATHAAAAKVSREKAAQNALPQLQSIMAAASRSLARAEKHHEKAVKKAKAKVDDLFQSQAKFMGLQVVKYASELDQAAQELSAVINASKAELAAEEAAEAKNASISWGGTAVEERARAGAKADAALRELHHIMRRRDSSVEEATRHALEPIEEVAQKLSRRVGDLSDLSDDAKASLEWAVKKGGVGGSMLAAVNITKDAKAIEMVIAAARNSTQLKIKAADKELAAAIANATNVTMAEGKTIEQGLVDAEKEEIKRVRR